MPDIEPAAQPWDRARIRRMVAEEAAELDEARKCGVNIRNRLNAYHDRFLLAIADEPPEQQARLMDMRTLELEARIAELRATAEHDRLYGFNARNLALGVFWSVVALLVMHFWLHMF